MPACPTCSKHFDEGVRFCSIHGVELIPDGILPPDEERLAPGTVVGEYRVEGLLGEGGFGAVYRGLHPVIGKSAAVKVLKREFSAKAEMVSRFVAEARAVNQIRHRNIIDVFGFGQLPDGRHYYVMELLEGTTLDRHLKARGRLPPAEALAILRPLARALGAAHARGIAHRDLKPENVFLTLDEDGRPMPKLLDFGIAKLAGDLGAQHKTRSGVPMGTPSYMSPEQVHGRAIDHRTDIYAFGVVVFELLTGSLPFDGDSMLDVMVKQASAAAPPMSSRVPELPSSLDAPVLHMMAKDPAQRPASVLAAMDELTEAAVSAGIVEATKFSPLSTAGNSGMSTPISLPLASSDEVSNAATVLAPDAAGARTFVGTEKDAKGAASRSKAPVLAVAGVALLGVALGAYFALREPQSTAVAAAGAPTSPASAAPSSSTSAPGVLVVPSSASATPSPSTSVEVAPSKVALRIKSVPPDADVFLDGKRLGAASETLELDFGKEPVKLELKKKGYLPAELSVVPDHDLAEPVILKAAPAARKREYGFDE